MRIKLVTATFIFLFSSNSVLALEYYVSPNGTDSGSGSQSQPWQTVAKGFSSLRAGDTLYLRDGTYNAPNTGWGFANSGTESQPITVTNYPGEQAILHTPNMDKSGNYTIKCLADSTPVDYVRIRGTDVSSPRNIPNGYTSQKGLVITGVDPSLAPAIVAYNCDYWEISGIDFISVAYAIFQRKVDYGAKSADRWNVHHNRVYNFHRESGMQFNGNGNTITNNEIYKVSNSLNSTFGCQHLNLLGNNNVVRNNTLSRHGSTYRCIGIFFEWDLADNNLVENNTISQVPVGISFFGGDNNVIRNNNISGTDVAINITSHPDTISDYPCNFSYFMPQANDTNNPDYPYYYPHDCKSKNNRIEGNQFSGFTIALRQGPLQEPSNIISNITPSTKPGDLNGDGSVNLLDFNLLITNFGNPYTIFNFNDLVSNYGK